jgi:DNA polymerase-3 subunit delta
MITILTGSNNHQLKQVKFDLVESFIKQNGEHAVEQIDASTKSIDEILGSVQSMPFLADKKLVVLSELAGNKELTGDVQKLLDVVIDQVDLVVYLPVVDKRSVLYKTLKKQPGFKDLKALDENQLVSWLLDQAKANNLKLSNSDARYMVNYVGTDQVRLGNELDKLGNYDKQITKDLIEKLTVKSIQSTTFDMLDAAFAGKTDQAIRFYKEQRILGVEPQVIMGALIWQLRVILALKFSKFDVAETARQSKFSPYSLNKSKRLADSISKNQLKQLVSSVLQLDIASKSKPIDIDEAIMAKFIEIGELV